MNASKKNDGSPSALPAASRKHHQEAPSPRPSPPPTGRERAAPHCADSGISPLSPSEGERVGVRGPLGGPEMHPASPAEPPIPSHIDRRTFLIRNAVIGAAAVMTGKTWTPEARAQQAAKEAGGPKLGGQLSPDLDVVKKSKGPVMTLVDEFYKVGPGPS